MRSKLLNILRKLPYYKNIHFVIFNFINRSKKKFNCPICGNYGPFFDCKLKYGISESVICLKCRSYPRHRLQFLSLNYLSKKIDFSNMIMLHVSPERCLADILKKKVKKYITIDLRMSNVNIRGDLTQLPFQKETFDIVYASHVLEHIRDDEKAIAELRRVIKTDGVAILPVPIHVNKTVEYPEPNLFESGHVRAIGLDYFNKYSNFFSKLEVLSSNDLDKANMFQTYSIIDRSIFPTKDSPFRTPMKGKKHCDFVPICFA